MSQPFIFIESTQKRAEPRLQDTLIDHPTSHGTFLFVVHRTALITVAAAGKIGVRAVIIPD